MIKPPTPQPAEPGESTAQDAERGAAIAKCRNRMQSQCINTKKELDIAVIDIYGELYDTGYNAALTAAEPAGGASEECGNCGTPKSDHECRDGKMSDAQRLCGCKGFIAISTKPQADAKADREATKADSKLLERIQKMLSDAADDDAFARNHGDGANLTGLPPRDIYEVGRSTLLLNFMGRFTAIKTDYLKAQLAKHGKVSMEEGSGS